MLFCVRLEARGRIPPPSHLVFVKATRIRVTLFGKINAGLAILNFLDYLSNLEISNIDQGRYSWKVLVPLRSRGRYETEADELTSHTRQRATASCVVNAREKILKEIETSHLLTKNIEC